MTKTLNEEYAQVVQEVEGILDKLEIHEKALKNDISNSDQLLKRLAAKAKINQKITPKEISVLSMYVHQAISGESVNSAMFEFILASMMKLAALLQSEERMKLDVPLNIAKQLQEWSQWQKRAMNAARQYQQ